MDADCQQRRRDLDFSQREKRWSMNSQRLEEIVAELMKPISDVRRSFDTDLSALLEEYLTEAGLHALESEEEVVPPPAVNFAELALVLQHSASVYGRKVDLLYQRVLDVSDDLLNSTQEIANAAPSEPATPSGRRKRRASRSLAGFDRVELAASGAARRPPAAPRPPPTLPRVYVELEPRSRAACDVPLADYDGEPVGLLADFHVTWRLQDGVLVDELEGSGASSTGSLRPIPLAELSAAIAAAAPPEPPPPPRCSTPFDCSATPPHDFNETLNSTIEMTPVQKSERKRRCEAKVEDVGRVKILISKALRRELSTVREFSVAGSWLRAVLRARARRVLELRARAPACGPAEFRGFDCSTACGAGGFQGWSDAEGLRAAERARGSLRPRDGDSDDDGFFERSSLGDSDGSRADDQGEALGEASAEWQRGVLARAAAGEARALHVSAAAARVLHALHAPAHALHAPAHAPAPAHALHAPARFPRVLAAAGAQPHDVSGLFLATLFLANSGNVEIIQGAPLTLDSFSVRLLSRDLSKLSGS